MVLQSRLDWLPALRINLGVSVILHLAWEILQLPLYTIWRTGTPREIAFAAVHCTAGDFIITSLALLTALLVVGDHAWPNERFMPVMIATLAIGIGYTLYSEWLNTVWRQS